MCQSTLPGSFGLRVDRPMLLGLRQPRLSKEEVQLLSISLLSISCHSGKIISKNHKLDRRVVDLLVRIQSKHGFELCGDEIVVLFQYSVFSPESL